ADVMPAAAGSLGGGLVSIVTIQGELPALSLFAPVLLLGVIAYGISGVFGSRLQARPPLFAIPGAVGLGRWLGRGRAATVPEEYRSIVNPRALEAAAAGGKPLLWLAALVALAFAANR